MKKWVKIVFLLAFIVHTCEWFQPFPLFILFDVAARKNIRLFISVRLICRKIIFFNVTSKKNFHRATSNVESVIHKKRKGSSNSDVSAVRKYV